MPSVHGRHFSLWCAKKGDLPMSWNLQETIIYYKQQGAPGDQHALIDLLREVQQESGGRIPSDAPAIIAQAYGVKESLLLAIIKRIPSLQLADCHSLELCAGPNCGKHIELAALAEKESPGKFNVKYVPCMRLCGKGPNLRWDGKLYQHADTALLQRLIAGNRECDF